MLWVGVACLSVLALVPLILAIRAPMPARGRREAALALHRAQLVELGRDVEEGRIGVTEHAAAVLEVQRRLLAAAESRERGFLRGSRAPLLIALIAVPVTGVLLYLSGGTPGLPAEPLAPRLAAAAQAMHEDTALTAKLKQVISKLDPHSEAARKGYVLLGGVEARLGNMQAAADAWSAALAVRFEPALAAEVAEATTDANGRVTRGAAELFQRALDAAPPNAPWRAMAQRRLAQANEPAPAITTGR